MGTNATPGGSEVGSCTVGVYLTRDLISRLDAFCRAAEGREAGAVMSRSAAIQRLLNGALRALEGRWLAETMVQATSRSCGEMGALQRGLPKSWRTAPPANGEATHPMDADQGAAPRGGTPLPAQRAGECPPLRPETSDSNGGAK